MSASVLLAPCGTRIWVQETLDKEQSAERSQILGGEGRGLGQRGCRGRHQGGTGWEQAGAAHRDLAALPWGECRPRGVRSARSCNTVGCSQEGPWQELSLDPSLSTPTPRGQVSGFRHSCLAGSQNQQRGQHMPAGLGHRSILLPNSLPLSHLRQCSLIPSAAPRKTAALPAHSHGEEQGDREQDMCQPCCAGELGHSCDMGLRPTGRDTKPADWEALGTADSSRESPELTKESLFQSLVAT